MQKVKRLAEHIVSIDIPSADYLPQSGERGRELLLFLRQRTHYLRERIKRRGALPADYDRRELDALEWLIASIILIEENLDDAGVAPRSVPLPKSPAEWPRVPESLPHSGTRGAGRLRVLARRVTYLNRKATLSVWEGTELFALVHLATHVINLETELAH